MRVLVTGGTGFLGSRLIERLRQRGDEVLCVAKDEMNSAFLKSLGVTVTLGDLNNGISWDPVLSDVECVFHLAGVTRAISSREYYQGNHSATKRLVEVCMTNHSRIKRFVYVSSLAAIGPALDGRPVTEDEPYHPVSHYGKSKMMGELEVLKAQDRLPITIVRPSAVYGPRERDMFEYMRLIIRGIQPLIGFDRKRLSLLHSYDLIEGILLASEHSHSIGEVYFLGSEQVYSMQDVGDAIARAVKRVPVKIRLPHSFVYTVGAIAGMVGTITGKQIFFNFQKAKESVQPAWICSVSKARQQLGFRQQITLDHGMVQTYSWYKEQGWL